LEDDLHLAPHPAELLAPERRQLLAHERDRPGGRLQELEDAVAGRRLPRPRLPDEPERLALGDVEADPVDRLDRADGPLPQEPLADREVLLQVSDGEECAVEGRSLGAHAFTVSRSPERSLVGCAVRTRWPGRI